MKTNRLILFLVVLLYACDSDTAKNRQADGSLTILTYGLPGPRDLQNAEGAVAKKWGIKYKTVAGCMVTTQLVDSVKEHNAGVYSRIEKNYGHNWNKKFAAEVERELSTQRKVTALLNKQKRNLTKNNELKKEGNGLHYTIIPLKADSLYEALATGWGEINGKSEYVVYYKYLINLNNSRVELLSDTISKL